MSPDRDSIAAVEYALRVRHDARYFARIVLQLLFGASMALSLAWFMHYLIQSSDLRLEQSDRLMMLDFVRIKREETVQRKRRTPDRPELAKAPEIPPLSESQADASGQRLEVSAMPATSDIQISQSGIGFGAGEGDYLPIVKVAPLYPRAAMMKGIEGTCVVRYTVTAAGTVKDVEVAEDQCDNAVFYRSSIEAAKRFKYKPRVIDGVPLEVHGVYNRFYYNFSDDKGN
jgi:protein TonB